MPLNSSSAGDRSAFFAIIALQVRFVSKTRVALQHRSSNTPQKSKSSQQTDSRDGTTKYDRRSRRKRRMQVSKVLLTALRIQRASSAAPLAGAGQPQNLSPGHELGIRAHSYSFPPEASDIPEARSEGKTKRERRETKRKMRKTKSKK